MKYYAIFNKDGSLLCYAHEGYENLKLPAYRDYTGLIVKKIDIVNNDFDIKLVDDKIIKTTKEKKI